MHIVYDELELDSVQWVDTVMDAFYYGNESFLSKKDNNFVQILWICEFLMWFIFQHAENSLITSYFDGHK